ncbi:MAG: sugar transferase [Deltaproteobacteria bacterium]|nr:sugar transferase [Deltaproteobacteria bacterium]
MNLSFRRQMVNLSHQILDGFTFLVACWVGIYAALWPDGRLLTAGLQGDLNFTDFLVLLAGLRASTAFQNLPRGMRRFERFLTHAWTAARQVALAAAVIAAGGVVLGGTVLPTKAFIVAFFSSLLVLRVGGRILQQSLFVRLRRRGRNLRIALIVGSGPRAARIVREIELHPEYGYFIAGFVDNPMPRPAVTLEWLGRLRELPQVIEKTRVDEVFIALPLRSQYDEILRAIETCEEQGIAVHLPGNLFTLAVAHATSTSLAATPLISIVSSGPMDGIPYLMKRTLDRVGAATLLLVLSPLFLAIALAIRVTMGSPVLFRQPRVGYQRRVFTCYKFRTMVNDADRRMAELETMNEADGPVFKIKDDPRVTPLGAWLRRTSMDELPQLINVLRGDMSLVGPRPLPLRDVSLFDRPSLNRRFSVWPGITCTWQVSGRSDTSFEDWINLDLEYVDNWSLGRDVQILLQTVQAVVKGRGAY